MSLASKISETLSTAYEDVSDLLRALVQDVQQSPPGEKSQVLPQPPKASNQKDFFCRPLNLHRIQLGDIGTVAPQPLSKKLFSWEDLKNPSSIGKDPVYLETYPGYLFCAYPINHVNFRNPNSKPFAPENIFRAETQQYPDLFGKPTKLAFSRGATFYSYIYDPEQGYFYASAVDQRGWYLVGDLYSLALFLEGIESYADYLVNQWKTNLLSFVPQEKEAKASEGFNLEKSIRASTEAWQEIRPFLRWLQTKDTKLEANIEGPLHYDPSVYEDSRYAYFAPEEDRIYLTPPSIQLLRDRDYESVALILAHEWKHRENYRLGLVPTSREMMWRALEVFAYRLDSEDLFFKVFHTWAFPDLLENICHTLLPETYEDEISAYAAGLSYAEHKGLKFASARKESFLWMGDTANDLYNNFPVGWSMLASEYFFLANSSFDDPIHNYLREYFQERLQCARDRTSCGGTPAWQALEQYLQSSHVYD